MRAMKRTSIMCLSILVMMLWIGVRASVFSALERTGSEVLATTVKSLPISVGDNSEAPPWRLQINNRTDSFDVIVGLANQVASTTCKPQSLTYITPHSLEGSNTIQYRIVLFNKAVDQFLWQRFYLTVVTGSKANAACLRSTPLTLNSDVQVLPLPNISWPMHSISDYRYGQGLLQTADFVSNTNHLAPIVNGFVPTGTVQGRAYVGKAALTWVVDGDSSVGKDGKPLKEEGCRTILTIENLDEISVPRVVDPPNVMVPWNLCFVVGDSALGQGRVYMQTAGFAPRQYFGGRWCSGMNFVDYVSYFNNIETTVNYAQGGAQVVGAASSTPSPLMSAFMNPNMSYIDQTIPEQVNDAIKSKYFKRPDQAILFLIYGGADDYIKLAKGGQTGDKIFLETVDGCTSKAVEVANKLFTAAKTAQEALWGHARIGQVVVMGVPNLQAAPVFANIVEQTTDYVTMVNDTLKKNINSFNANHVSQEIIYFDAGLTETLLAGLLLETDAHYFTESVTEYNKYYFLGYEGKSLGSHEGGLNFSTPSFKKLTYNSWLSNQYLYKFYDFIHPSSSNSLLTALVFSYVINNTMGITEGSADADRIKAWKIGNKEMILKYLRNQYINPFCPEVLKTGPHGEFIDDYKYYRYYRVPPDIDISDAELASATVDNEGPL